MYADYPKGRVKTFAGIKTWGEATDEEKTITCGKLINGKVEYGILKELGLADEKPQGKKVKIRLAEGQEIEGILIE